MNDLLSQTFGAPLTSFGAAMRAVFVLSIFPAYYFILFALGTYLFFRSRRLRIEQRQHIDLLLGEFPALEGRYVTPDADPGKPKKKVPEPSKAPVEEEKPETAEEIAEVTEEREGADAESSEANEGRDEGRKRRAEPDPATAPIGKFREGMWEIAVHDAPLMLLSAVIVCALLVSATLAEPLFDGDPLTQFLTNSAGANEGALLQLLLLGPTAFLVPMLLYTLGGFVAMAWLSGLLFKVFALEWLHVEPYSRRSRRVWRIWRRFCFVNFSRLDGSVGKWLVFLVPGYLVLLAAVDFLALLYSFPLPPALLAAAHLFPLALPRMFAQVWASPIDFTRPPSAGIRYLDVEELPEHLSSPEYLGGLVDGPVIQAQHSITLPAGNPLAAEQRTLPRRLEFALEFQAREDLVPFVSRAVEVLLDRRSSLIVSGPAGSGRGVVAGLSILEAAFRGVSSLVLVETADEARRLVREFRKLACGFPAAEFFNVEWAGDNLAFEVKGLADKIDVLIADMASFDRVARQHEYFSVFWRRMGLAVLFGFDEASPLVKAEIPFLLARTSLLRRNGPTLPVLVSLLDGARADHRSFTNLLGRNLAELPLGHACPVRLDLLTLAPIGKSSIAVERDLDLLSRFGQGLADAGYHKFFLGTGTHSRGALARLDQAGWVTRAGELAGQPVAVSLVRLRPETFFNQVSRIRELSRVSENGHHICFLLPPIDGFDEWMHRHLEELLEHRHDHVSPALIPGTANSALLRKHVLRALLEQPLDRDAISRHFGYGAVRRLGRDTDAGGKTAGGTVEVEEDPIRGPVFRFVPAPGGPVARSRTADGAVVSTDAEQPPILVRCKALDIERQIDATRQKSVLWPGRVFDLDGERVRVRGGVVEGVLECDPEEEDLRTLPIRQLFVTENRDIRMASDHVFDEEGVGIYRAALEVEELIIGYRTWKGRDLVQESLYGVGEQVLNRYVADAAVLFFPGLDPESVHLIAHVLKRYLKLIHGDTDSVIDVTHNCFEPFSKGVSANLYHDVTLVDNVPGGTGLCDLITPTFLRKVAAMVVSMDGEGVPWSRIQECCYPQLGRFDDVPPDKAPEVDTSVADRLVSYFRKVLLAEERDKDEEPLDYACNLWHEELGGPPPVADAVPFDDAGRPEESPELAEASVSHRELMARVYAEANRIGRPARPGQGS